jgi:hypothetical protein
VAVVASATRLESFLSSTAVADDDEDDEDDDDNDDDAQATGSTGRGGAGGGGGGAGDTGEGGLGTVGAVVDSRAGGVAPTQRLLWTRAPSSSKSPRAK